MTQEIVASQDNTIEYAISKGATIEQLEKLLLIKERYEATEAKKAFHLAMTAFKKNPPDIKKDKTVSFGQTRYNHASLANVTECINSELSKHGLSASWATHQNGQISVTCKITHVQGHSEETTLTAPADTSGSKNAIQAIGSAISYLQRYTILALTGLATSENDDDGAILTSFIDDKEHAHLVELVDSYEVVLPAFLNYLKVESLAKLPKADYQKAVAALEAKRKAKK